MDLPASSVEVTPVSAAATAAPGSTIVVTASVATASTAVEVTPVSAAATAVPGTTATTATATTATAQRTAAVFGQRGCMTRGRGVGRFLLPAPTRASAARDSYIRGQLGARSRPSGIVRHPHSRGMSLHGSRQPVVRAASRSQPRPAYDAAAALVAHARAVYSRGMRRPSHSRPTIRPSTRPALLSTSSTTPTSKRRRSASPSQPAEQSRPVKRNSPAELSQTESSQPSSPDIVPSQPVAEATQPCQTESSQPSSPDTVPSQPVAEATQPCQTESSQPSRPDTEPSQPVAEQNQITVEIGVQTIGSAEAAAAEEVERVRKMRLAIEKELRKARKATKLIELERVKARKARINLEQEVEMARKARAELEQIAAQGSFQPAPEAPPSTTSQLQQQDVTPALQEVEEEEAEVLRADRTIHSEPMVNIEPVAIQPDMEQQHHHTPASPLAFQVEEDEAAVEPVQEEVQPIPVEEEEVTAPTSTQTTAFKTTRRHFFLNCKVVDLMMDDVADMEVAVTSPSGQDVIDFYFKTLPNGHQGLVFTPREAGEHVVNLRDKEVPTENASFRVNIEKNSLGMAEDIEIAGMGIITGTMNRWTPLYIDRSSSGYGDLSVRVRGPGKVGLKCDRHNHGIVSLSYKARYPGEYQFTIKFAGRNIKDSPFYPVISQDGEDNEDGGSGDVGTAACPAASPAASPEPPQQPQDQAPEHEEEDQGSLDQGQDQVPDQGQDDHGPVNPPPQGPVIPPPQGPVNPPPQGPVNPPPQPQGQDQGQGRKRGRPRKDSGTQRRKSARIEARQVGDQAGGHQHRYPRRQRREPVWMKDYVKK